MGSRLPPFRPPPTHLHFPESLLRLPRQREEAAEHMGVLVKYVESVSCVWKLMRILAFMDLQAGSAGRPGSKVEAWGRQFRAAWPELWASGREG